MYNNQLTFDSQEKEPPEYQNVDKEAKKIAKHHLCSDCPPEKAKITGMSKPCVDTMFN